MKPVAIVTGANSGIGKLRPLQAVVCFKYASAITD